MCRKKKVNHLSENYGPPPTPPSPFQPSSLPAWKKSTSFPYSLFSIPFNIFTPFPSLPPFYFVSFSLKKKYIFLLSLFSLPFRPFAPFPSLRSLFYFLITLFKKSKIFIASRTRLGCPFCLLETRSELWLNKCLMFQHLF